MDALTAIALVLLIIGGRIIGTQGLQVKPFINTAIVRHVVTNRVTYDCPPHVAASLATGQSHLDPNVFCTRVPGV